MGAKSKAKHKIFFNPVQSSVFSESSNAVPKLYFIEVALNTQFVQISERNSLSLLPLIFLWHTHGRISITAASHRESHITTTGGALRCDPPLLSLVEDSSN
nr:hypothetical protein CFP56_33239 [Quercus suber]